MQTSSKNHPEPFRSLAWDWKSPGPPKKSHLKVLLYIIAIKFQIAMLDRLKFTFRLPLGPHVFFVIPITFVFQKGYF